MRRAIVYLASSLAAAAVLALIVACVIVFAPTGRKPVPNDPPGYDRTQLRADLIDNGFAMGNPAFIRIFKREARLEVWMQRDGGPFVKFRDYPICHYSGGLGPKLIEGDKQAPEGFYRIGQRQLNPNSRHHLAFNLGFPNAYDQALGRTGSALMVHGGCTSVGCYAMTDENIDQIYAIVQAALDAGQDAVDVQALPFVMDNAALSEIAQSPWSAFWTNLKQGYDLFETARMPPRIGVCNGDYRFGSGLDAPGCVEIGYWRA